VRGEKKQLRSRNHPFPPSLFLLLRHSTHTRLLTHVATLAWCCTVPTVPRWRNSGRHIPVKIIYFLPCYFLFIPTAFTCTRIKQTPYKNIKH
jgi:hypothetical protein